MQRLVPIALLAASAAGQTGDLNAQLAKTVLYRDPAISPNGEFAAWAQTTLGEDRPQLHIRPADGAREARLVRAASGGKRRDSDPAFSPDSKTLAFFSKAGERKQPQLWTLALPGVTARKLTDLKGHCARPRWSRDGKQIAFLYIEGGEGGGPLLAAPAQTGVIEAKIHNQRIAVLDPVSGDVRQASPPDLHVYDFDWSPDGARFVMTAAPGPGDNNWWIARIYVADGDAKAKVIYEPKWQIAVPRWSPDGRTIAFIEGLMSDEGFHGGDLLTMEPDGSAVINRTRGRKTSVSSLFWTAAGKLMVTE